MPFKAEFLFLTFHLVFEISSEGFVPKGRNKNCLRLDTRIGGHSIRQLIDVTKQACFQQRIYHLLATHAANVALSEVRKLLLSIGINLDAEHFPAFTTHHFADGTAHRRGKLHIGILFVDKQGIPGFNLVTFLDNDFWSDPLEIVRH